MKINKRIYFESNEVKDMIANKLGIRDTSSFDIECIIPNVKSKGIISLEVEIEEYKKEPLFPS